MRLRPFVVAAACVAAGTLASAARADDNTPPPLVPLPYGMTLNGHIEGGTTINTDDPNNNINFGQTFNDRAQTFRVNQAMLTLQKALDPKDTGYQWGFKLQGMYGTDSRVTHFFNEFDRSTNSPYQWDIIEANVQAHLPYWFEGTDVKLGQYATPLGYEVIDATGNPFYSHSYIFFYGLPFKHTGLLTTTHVNDTLDLWLGLDTGVNDSLGAKGMANNEFPKALFGFGLNNLMDGKLTILALAHIGPEAADIFEATSAVTNQPAGGPVTAVPGANSKLVQFYDGVITYKINDSWTSTTEINYVKSDFLAASAGGAATYLSWAYDDQWTFNARAEAFADQSTGAGGFVTVATNSLGYVNGARGLAPSLGYGGNINTGAPYNVVYGEITLGATYKPALPWNQINAAIRPEIRYDSVIGGSKGIKPFNVNGAGVGTKTSQVTLAVDFILGF